MLLPHEEPNERSESSETLQYCSKHITFASKYHWESRITVPKVFFLLQRSFEDFSLDYALNLILFLTVFSFNFKNEFKINLLFLNSFHLLNFLFILVFTFELLQLCCNCIFEFFVLRTFLFHDLRRQPFDNLLFIS